MDVMKATPEMIEESWIALVKYNRERAGIAEDRVKVLEAEVARLTRVGNNLLNESCPNHGPRKIR